MVVLSACETGTGKYYKGEGMMSLARAFLQSGSPSVVTSLWRVDDRSTGEIMQGFYKNLMAGNAKGEAIRAAKLDYLAEKESETLHHPYYWAPFIQIGDPEPLDFPASFPFWLVGLMVVLGMGIFWYLQRNKN
jgi:CHAT domain-containing protein